MKILMINVVCGIRSTGRICTDIAKALEAKGHEVKIAYGRERVPEDCRKYAVRIGNGVDVILHALKARLFDASGFGGRRATERFVEWVKEYNPDIIHLHNIHGYYINIEVLFNYLRTCGKRIIWTMHDCWAITGHTPYCSFIDCEKWKSGCGKCGLKKEYPKTIIDNSSYNWLKKRELFSDIENLSIVTPSSWLATIINQSYMSGYNTDVIHNGIDTSVFYPRKTALKENLGLSDKVVVMGCATAWDKMKGLSDFYKLSERLGSGFKIVLVGLTDCQIKKLPSGIIGIKRTASPNQLAEYYSMADVFLNLSYCENYPTVNLEAMACGTPVITYRTGGSPESANNSGGVVVEKGDIDGLVKAISALINNNTNLFNPFENDYKTMVNNYVYLYAYSNQ